MARRKSPVESLSVFNVELFIKVIFEAQEWPFILMAGTMIETFLELGINLRFANQLSKTQYAEVFSGHGPMANFSGKIVIGYATGALSKDAAHDLRIIKEVRNNAAHCITEFKLNDEISLKYINNLKLITPAPEEWLAERPLASAQWKRMTPGSPRQKVTLSFFHIMNNIASNFKSHQFLKSILQKMNEVGANLPRASEEEIKASFAAFGYDYPSLRPLQ